MENDERILSVGLDNLHRYANESCPERDDAAEEYEIFILEDVGKLMQKEAFKIDLVMVLFCLEGKAQLRLNGKKYEAAKNDMIVCMPSLLVEDVLVSPDFKCAVMGMSYKSVQNMRKVNRHTWSTLMFIGQNPVVHLDDSALRVVGLYSSLLDEKLKHKDQLFHREIVHLVFECLFYELESMLYPQLRDTDAGGNSGQGETLCKRFFELLALDGGRERSVTRIAARLNVTPKHLSTSIKHVSGKTAIQWIHEQTLAIIKQQLKYTDRSIKEISDDLKFPNLSYFGKFFRAHCGVSPTEFRRQV